MHVMTVPNTLAMRAFYVADSPEDNLPPAYMPKIPAPGCGQPAIAPALSPPARRSYTSPHFPTPMTRRLPLVPIALLCLTLGACFPQSGSPADVTGSSASSSAASQDPGEEASYQGLLEETGPSIYMQGSHRLMLDGGQFLLLESTRVDLDAFAGTEVEVHGLVRSTVESAGRIMDVREILALEPATGESASSAEASSSETSSVPSSEASSPVASSLAASSKMPPAAPSSAPKPAASSAKPVVIASSKAAAEPPLGAAPADEPQDAFSQRVAAMAKYNYALSNWTKTYVTPHQGFSFPLHKNFWFKSFGSTASSLWRVELSNAEIDKLGEGPIIINLLPGGAAAAGAADGEIKAQGSTVIGYRSWKENEHIEVLAPQELRAAVQVITAGIKEAAVASSAASSAR